MNNPYQSPSSDVTVDEKIEDRRLGWKIFFFIMLALHFFGLSFMVDEYRENAFDPYDIPELLVYPVILLGFFGYAFHKIFFKQGFWRVFFPIAIGVDIFSLWNDFAMDPEVFNSTGGTVGLIIMMVIIVPIFLLQYLALYRYGFSTLSPWDKKGD